MAGHEACALVLAGSLHQAEHPGQQLPVASRPAMLACGGHVVAGGKLLDHLDIGREPRAGEHALEEIVAQHRAVGDAALQRRFEGIDVVDALSGVRALAEQVLIDVGHRGRVGVDAVVARKDALEQRAFGTDRQRGRDARLQHAVALGDAMLERIEARPVERMRHLADQARDRVPGQSCIRIEGDHVAHVGGQRSAADFEKRRLARAAQEMIELMQLAALAFPADPPSLRLVPAAAAMEQEEASGARDAGIARVELGDAVGGRGQQVGILRRRLGHRVGPVGQQREVDLPRRIGKVMNLEPPDLLVDRGAGRQQDRDSDHGARFRRHPVGQRHAGNSVAPKPPVTARLTSISAASIAGSRPMKAMIPRDHPPTPSHARPSIGRMRTTLAISATLPT